MNNSNNLNILNNTKPQLQRPSYIDLPVLPLPLIDMQQIH